MKFAGFFLLSWAAMAANAWAQDPGMVAAQLANDAAMQATQQANQAAMQATQTAMMASQMAASSGDDSGPVIGFAQKPAFTVKPGKVDKGTLLRLECDTRDSTIYYSTSGWTATRRSTLYEGPIVLNATTHVSAICWAPHMLRSRVAVGDFIVESPAPAPAQAVMTQGVLKAGTLLPLTVIEGKDSKTAEVGDALKLALNTDVQVGDTVVLKKGTEVEGKITALNRAGHGGAPGDLTFVVRALHASSLTVPLLGGETLEGADGVRRVKSVLFIPAVGVAGIALRGDEAMIKPGMTLLATVALDTPLAH